MTKLDRPRLVGTMTRRSCAIYATGIVCAHLLIVGIALLVAQVFQTMIHSRLKQVSHSALPSEPASPEPYHRVPYVSFWCPSTTLPHFLRPSMSSMFHLQWQQEWLQPVFVDRAFTSVNRLLNLNVFIVRPFCCILHPDCSLSHN